MFRKLLIATKLKEHVISRSLDCTNLPSRKQLSKQHKAYIIDIHVVLCLNISLSQLTTHFWTVFYWICCADQVSLTQWLLTLTAQFWSWCIRVSNLKPNISGLYSSMTTHSYWIYTLTTHLWWKGHSDYGFWTLFMPTNSFQMSIPATAITEEFIPTTLSCPCC